MACYISKASCLGDFWKVCNGTKLSNSRPQCNEKPFARGVSERMPFPRLRSRPTQFPIWTGPRPARQCCRERTILSACFVGCAAKATTRLRLRRIGHILSPRTHERMGTTSRAIRSAATWSAFILSLQVRPGDLDINGTHQIGL